jgi:O-antigen/teichoic acid export membrane protein
VLGLSGNAIMSVFGDGFAAGGTWLAIIGAACALNAFVGLGELILMVKRPGLNLVNSSIAIAATISLNMVLIPTLGPSGAAIGMLVPYGLQGVLRGVEIRWLFNWRWPFRALTKPWVAAVVALMPGVLVRVAAPGQAGQLGAGAVYLLAYVAAWRLIGLDPSDRAAFRYMLGRRDTPLWTNAG